MHPNKDGLQTRKPAALLIPTTSLKASSSPTTRKESRRLICPRPIRPTQSAPTSTSSSTQSSPLPSLNQVEREESLPKRTLLCGAELEEKTAAGQELMLILRPDSSPFGEQPSPASHVPSRSCLMPLAFDSRRQTPTECTSWFAFSPIPDVDPRLGFACSH